MKSVVKDIVTQEFAHKPLLLFLKKRMNISSTLIKKAKRITNGITVNGKLTFVNEIVNINDIVEIIIETNQEKSENIPICDDLPQVVFEDEYILIINKQGGIPTHPSLNNYGITVAGMVINYYLKQGLNFVFRPVNRLDKGTSGLMVIAKNPHIHELLKQQLHSNQFHREYLALVEGVVKTNGHIEAPIFREGNSIIKRVVDPRGSYAYTDYFVETNFSNNTLLRLVLKTGRTHQIRVHLSYINHPIIGDFLYGTERTDINRPALHSAKMMLIHPITKKELVFESPLPDDINYIIKKDR